MNQSYQPEKLFTVEEANRMLPLVSRIAADVQEIYRRLVDRVRRLQEMGISDLDQLAECDDGDVQRLRAELEEDQETLTGYVEELEDLGVLLKGEEQGLLDFPSIRDGRVVFLCWKVGEPTVAHWHEIDEGFLGRQAIDASRLAGAKD